MSNPAPSPTRLDLCFRYLLCLAPFAIAVVTAVGPITDPDVWFHIRVGEWIEEQRAFPTTDPFTTYGQGKHWIAYSWLFEVLVHKLYAWFGLTGLLLYRAIMAVLVMAVLFRLVARRAPRLPVAVGLLGLAAAACTPIWDVRPWMFTILLFAWTMDVVLDCREGRATWTAWLLPLGYIVWANSHIQFVHGLFVLGLACAAPVIDRLLGQADAAATAGSPGWWKLVGLTAACFLATLVNPYHVELYEVVIQYARQPGPAHLIREHQPPAFQELADWLMAGLLLVAVIFLVRRPKLSAFDVLLLLAGAYFAFKAARDVWFLAIAALAVCVSGPKPEVPEAERFDLTPWRCLGIGIGVVLISAAIALAKGLSEPRLEFIVAKVYPAEAVGVVTRNGFAGPIFNDYDWGSYLLWRLPDRLVAIDGRTHLHGDERIERNGETWSGKPGWEDDPDLAAAKLIIAPKKWQLTELLKNDPRFRLVHEDDLAVVFVRSK